jgi:hypothetical protein
VGPVKNRLEPSGRGFRGRTLRARYAPAEPRTKSLKLIAIIEPEKRLPCFLVEGEPRAGISPVADDLDGTHWPSQTLGIAHPPSYDWSRPNYYQHFRVDIHRLSPTFMGVPAVRVR